MIPLYTSEGPQTVLGLPCAQNALALPTWEFAFKVHPPRRLIEIGSGTGAFTYALKQALGPDISVFSWDVTKAPTEGFEKRFKLHPDFTCQDALGDPGFETVRLLINCVGTSYVLCDGGNKAKEFESFAPCLKSGDVIGIHDFASDAWPWSEITLAQTEPIAKKVGLERWLSHEFEAAGWLVYRRI